VKEKIEAMNILSKLFGNSTASDTPSTRLTASDYKSRFVETKEPHLLVDVRTTAEFADGHITGARNLPVQELDRKLREVPTDKPVILYCRSGSRSGMALQMLQSAGYTNVYNVGSYQDLARQGLPVKSSTRH
jgi:rhodanese-related sulfurtransferase